MMKSEHQQRVEEFMRKAGQSLPDTPTVPAEDVRLLRSKLILEEALETIEALGVGVDLQYYDFGGNAYPVSMDHIKLRARPSIISLVEIADGCADISVVNVGTLSACGISDMAVLKEVDRSNLDKFRGDAHRREDGKWIKPSDWKPPDLETVLRLQGLTNV